MNNRVTLVGNLILDTVYLVPGAVKANTSNECKSSYESAGGIFNLVGPLKKRGREVELISRVGKDRVGQVIKELIAEVPSNLRIDDGSSSSAVIISSLHSNQRTSFVSWGACTRQDLKTVRHKDWVHLCYLDRMPYIDKNTMKMLRHQNQRVHVSADLCLEEHSEAERKRILDCLPYIDYLFLSETEAVSLCDNLDRAETAKQLGGSVRNCCIIHSPEHSLVSDGVRLLFNQVEDIVDGVNVLGAGDMLCAHVIGDLFDSSKNISEVTSSVSRAHKKISETFRKQLDD